MDKKTILLVEDDTFICQMYKTKFDKTNHELVMARDGQEGLEMIKKHKPDLVLLDIVLPGPDPDGFDVLTQIKNDPELNSIPVILLSNLGQENHIKKGMALGASDYLIKAHLTPQDVVDKVEAFFEKNTA